MNELPRRFYEPQTRARHARAVRITVALVLIGVAGWHLAGLPGLLQRLDFPADIPGFGHGLRSVSVNVDGHWVIRRSYYADRMSRYELTPDGELLRFAEAGMAPDQDVSNRLSMPIAAMPGGHRLRVKPSRSYYAEIAAARTDSGQPVPEGVLAEVQASPGQAAPVPEPHVQLVLTAADEQRLPVLIGHQYFRTLDGAAYIPPHLWLTTDRVSHLHRLHLSDEAGMIEVREEGSVALTARGNTVLDCALGLDPVSGELFMLLSDGQRHWFDPASLKQLRAEQLPGMWQREHAQLSFGSQRRASFPQYTAGGLPLTKAAYQRITAGLVLAFLGGSLLLLLEWRRAWRYTSARTIAASS